jgi:hypothetical protein
LSFSHHHPEVPPGDALALGGEFPAREHAAEQKCKYVAYGFHNTTFSDDAAKI